MILKTNLILWSIIFYSYSLCCQENRDNPEFLLKDIFFNKLNDVLSKSNLQYVSYSKYLEIKSQDDKKFILNQMLSGEYVYWPKYEKSDFSDLEVYPLNDFPLDERNKRIFLQDIRSALLKNLTEKLKIGDYVYLIKWEYNGIPLSNFCLLSDTRLIYDSLIFNLTTFKFETFIYEGGYIPAVDH